MHRRHFFGLVGASLAAGASSISRDAQSQEVTRNTTGSMDQDAYLSVQLPAKAGTHAQLTADQRDELEHHLHCQCGCGLDVYTCRTTDFSCSVSPRMHADVMGLVSGGYTADEIIAAFRRVYGERVLMAPVKEGFNWLGYTLPFVALATGGVVIATLLRRWSHPAASGAAVSTTATALGRERGVPHVEATPEELERLRELLRSDET